MPTVIHLVRHADVENPRQVLYGHLDGFPLSAIGRARATAVGEALRDAGVSRIVASPLERAVETATLIGRVVGVTDIETDGELREAEFSRYLQGLRYWQIPLLRPRWFVHKVNRGLLPDDEPISELGGRVLAVAARVATESADRTSVLVSHADPLQAAWILLDGRPHTEVEMHRKVVDRGGSIRVVYEAGRPTEWAYTPPPRVPASSAG